ncbi:MAG: asparagine synthase (glutamine-hydrolyzing) [Alphaproteobacteria bacterium]|nr:asparagine synthase (glutamine-hydrolyzing) [Alphaproteobacteria bacterium]
MCRVYGFFGNARISSEMLSNASKIQFNGGPDSQNVKAGKNWALGNNRLAIQGLDGGLQPFKSNKIHAVYNGEIYNYKELKDFLVTKGYAFHDNCDGSVIIPLYEIYGENFAMYLDGMFAIAIVDERSKTKLVLASDPCAVKSLYYYWDQVSDTLYFSSELLPLFEFPVNKHIRLEAIDEYLIGRSIWHNKTFFKDIYSLGPSFLLTKTKGYEPKLSQYQSNIKTHLDSSLNFQETAYYFNNLFEEEMLKVTQADVPICVVTSGGLDSSYITALASKYIPDLHCFNIAYEGNWPLDERVFAKEVSHHYDAKYTQVLIKEHEFPQLLKDTIFHLNQPNSAPHALSTYALFKSINEAGFKVAITGEGADEYFGGYERFRKATFNQDINWIEQYFDTMCATTQELRNTVYTEDYKKFLDSENHNLLKNAKKEILLKEKQIGKLKALLTFDQNERFPSYILRRVDHLSMANSVEVRVPFCQPRVASFSKSLPNNFLLNETSVKRIIYGAAHDKLPQSVLTRPKQPFTLPITAMFNKEHILFDILYETLNSSSFLSRNFFNYKNINSLIDKQINTPCSNTSDILWSIMILELWLQHIDSNISL